MPKKRSKKRRSSSAQPTGAEVVTPDPVEAEVPQPSEQTAASPESVAVVGGARRWVLDGIGVALVAAAVLSPSGADALRYPELWLIARIAVVLAGALWFYAWRCEGPRRRWLTSLVVGLGVVGLAAAYGREAALHQSPFAGLNSHILGVPTPLAFALLAATARWRATGDAPARASLGFVAALVWASAMLVLPSFTLSEGHIPIIEALSRLGSGELLTLSSGLALVACGLSVSAGWLLMIRPTSADGVAPKLATAGVIGIAVHHVLSGFDSATGPLIGVTIALALWLVVTAGQLLHRGAPLPAPQAVSLRRLLDIALPTSVLAVFFILKTHAMGPSNTDENIYFYMARELGEGRWPYSDYFFAHPPLHVVVPGTFFAIFGYSFTVAKLFSVIAASVAGFAVWRIGREHLGRTTGIFAMVLFLFAAETLKASSNMTGVNLTTMWMVLGIWQALKARGLTAGIFFGLAATTGFYSMAAICAMLALGLFRWPVDQGAWLLRLRFGLRQLLGFAAVFGAINAIFYMSAGSAFVDGVYSYHGLKAFQDPDMWEIFGGEHGFFSALLHNIGVVMDGQPFTKDFYYHGHLWMGLLSAPALGLVAYFMCPRGRAAPHRLLSVPRLWSDGGHGIAAILWLVGLALFVQYAMFRELYSFYWVLIYPLLALLVAYTVVHGARLLHSTHSAKLRMNALTAGLVVAVLGLFGSYRPLASDIAMVFPNEIERAASRNDYEWREAAVLPGLSGVVRTLFWEDYRLRGGGEPGYRHYLWTKKRRFVTLDDIAGYIRDNSTNRDTIAGASTAAPLIALAAKRRLAAGEADTNNKRFKTGLLKEPEYWRAICADNIKFIVATPRSYFTDSRMGSLKTAKTWFEKRRTFYDPELRYGGKFPISIYERVGTPIGPGQVCRWEE